MEHKRILQVNAGQSLGSGIIVSSDGYILTNAHAVAEAGGIKVRFNDRREMDAHLVGSDRYTDLALLKVEAHDLPVLPMGDSDQLQPGEWVAAVGAPSGFGQTISAGIISATHRTLADAGEVPLIQTDIAITAGNSGGPLLNLKGDVIGISNAKPASACRALRLSFATPSRVAAPIVEQLKRDGRVNRAWLGIALQPIDGRLARAFGRNVTQGALVVSVAPDSPAAHAGLQPGDIILGMAQQSMESVERVVQLIAGMAPGQGVVLDLWHHHQNRKVSVTLATSSLPTPSRQPLPSVFHANSGRLGVVVSALDDQGFFADETSQGLKIERVDGDSLAANAGLMPGDTLLELDSQAVSSPAQLTYIVDRLSSRQVVPIRVMRDGHAMYMALEMRGH